MEKIVSQSQCSLALEVKEEVIEPEFDLFVREKTLSMDANADPAKSAIKVSGSITVSF